MSWYLTIENAFDRISISRSSFSLINELDDKIEDQRNILRKAREELLIFSTIQKTLPLANSEEEPESTIYQIRSTFEELLETYDEIRDELMFLEKIKNIIEYDTVRIYCESTDKYYIKKNGEFIEVSKEEYKKYL